MRLSKDDIHELLFFALIWVLIILCGMVVRPAYGGYNVKILSTLQTEVRLCLATDADPFHPNDTITVFLNIACREVASYGVILKMDSVTAVADDQVKDLNDDALEIVAIFKDTIAGSQAYERIDFRAWGRIGGATGASATRFYAFQPQGKFIGGDSYKPKMWLYPAWSGPTDTLTVVYYAQANELSNANDTTLIPYQYTPLVVYFATALCYARARNFNEANWWFAFYDQQRQRKGLLRQLDYIIHPKEINK